MNTGAFGENFPYSNFHNLNMDWIIKIAKDFLDQYTHIQQVIEEGEASLTELTNTGLQQLEDKETELTNALDAWYTEHSEDIANKLTDALADFAQAYNTAITQFGVDAEAKAQETIGSIPSDYSTVANDVTQLKKALSVHTDIIKLANMVTVPNKYIDNTNGLEVSDNGWTSTGYIPLPKNCFYMHTISGSAGSSTSYNAFYDINRTFITNFYSDRVQYVPANARFVRFSQNNDQFSNMIMAFVTGEELIRNVEKTVVYQGQITNIERLNNSSIKVTLKHNPAGNLGYYQPPNTNNGQELYFNGKGGTLIEEGVYQYTIGAYNALVLDMSELYTSQYGQLQAKVVTYANIQPYHFILVRNSHDNTGLGIQGNMVTDKILSEYVNRRIANKDEVMKSICRMGDAYGLPESSNAIKKAYSAGYNYIRLNLQFTSDGVAVLWHDPCLNQYYHNVYNAEGVLVPYSSGSNIRIANTTFAILNQFKYGSASAPTGIPTLNTALKTARTIGMKVYLETKMSMTSSNMSTLASAIYTRGMMENVTLCTDDLTIAVEMSNRLPKLRIGLMGETLTDSMKTAFTSIIANGNPVMWWGYRTTVLDNNSMYYIAPKKIDYEVGDFQTLSEIDTYLAQSNALACTGMELEGAINPLIGQYIESVN